MKTEENEITKLVVTYSLWHCVYAVLCTAASSGNLQFVPLCLCCVVYRS
jgi:hypothetical protein